MKTLYHIYFSFLVCSLFPLFLEAQLPNNGFETWTNFQYYEEPQGYLTTAAQSYFSTQESNIKKVDGYQGFGVRLETSIGSDGAMAGGLFLGNPGAQGLSGGIPYSDKPDSLVFWARYNISPGDTSLLGLIFSVGGTPITFNIIPLEGNQNEFVRHSFPLEPYIVTPDSLLFIVFSSQPDSIPDPDTWLEIDEFQLTNANQQLPNSSMEIWTSYGGEEPDDWWTSNIFNLLAGQSPKVTRTTDSYEGDNAIRIETFEFSFDPGDTSHFGFILLNGALGENGPTGGVPYSLSTLMPRIGGYYKYLPVGQDTAFALLQFTKYNTSTMETDSIAEFSFLLPVKAAYVPFQFTMELPEMPDSVLIGFASSLIGDEESPNAMVGSVLYIDGLTFGDPVRTIDLMPEANIRLFPNPTREEVTLLYEELSVKTIQVFDGLGKEVLQMNSINAKEVTRFDVSGLPQGWYSVHIIAKEGSFNRKLAVFR